MTEVIQVKPSAERTGPAVSFARGAALVLAMVTAGSASAESTLLAVGKFAAVGTPCDHAAASDVLVSNGHTVSPQGESCRVVSRTSTGEYYPRFNISCSGGRTSDASFSVESSRSLSFQVSGQTSRSYRFCPAKPVRAETD